MLSKAYPEMHQTGSEEPSRGDEDWVDGEDRGDDDNSSYGEEYNDEEYDY
tara:strand:- start:279 stop:428 length:150 start_codon:yes stop_codon:yes gene_type:complete